MVRITCLLVLISAMPALPQPGASQIAEGQRMFESSCTACLGQIEPLFYRIRNGR
jgi:hypothetical protein